MYILFPDSLVAFLLDARSTHRERRCVDVDVDVVVGGAPLFKYKPKRRSGRLPVGPSCRSWDRHARQKAPTDRLRRSANKLHLSSFVRVSGAHAFLGSVSRGYLTTHILPAIKSSRNIHRVTDSHRSTAICVRCNLQILPRNTDFENRTILL